MSKKADQRITLNDFIAKRVKKYNSVPETVDIEFDGDLIPFNRPTEEQVLKYIDEISKAVKVDAQGNYLGQDSQLMFEASRDFVFVSCKYMQDKTLQAEFSVSEPTDVVSKVFGIEGTIEMATKIKEAFDLNKIYDEVASEVKN